MILKKEKLSDAINLRKKYISDFYKYIPVLILLNLIVDYFEIIFNYIRLKN